MNASSFNNSKTFQHDDIHLWLLDDKNLQGLIATLEGIDVNEQGIGTIKVSREIPFYSGSNYLSGICDCIVDYELYNKDQRLLIEIKPTLGSISGIIGQVKVYRDNLLRNFEGRYRIVIVTYDQNNAKYDKLLKAEGIDVYRISKATA